MCYSAQIQADYKRFVREHGATLSLRDFLDLFWRRAREAPALKMPKSIEALFLALGEAEAPGIAPLIAEHQAAEATRLEQDLFRQRKRLADAERSLQTKPTKTAAEHQRIAGAKVAWIMDKLAALRRTAPTEDDARFFPGWYAPVLVVEDGQRVVKPMRYQLRPAGRPASFDRQYPGTYNARRDNLRGFWQPQYGHTHGVLAIDAFYENVAQGDGHAVLEFRPRQQQPMLVACLFSRWTAPGQPELLSFAAITDEPPPEIAAAGHDRCVIPIKPQHVDAWLNPERMSRDAMDDILADRERPYFAHRLAA